MKNRRGQIEILGILALLGLAIAFSTGAISLGAISGDLNAEYIEAPFFGTITCEQSGTAKQVTAQVPGSGGTWISDGLPRNTNEWNLQLTNVDEGFFSVGRQWEYYICPQRAIRDNCLRKTDLKVNKRGDLKSIGSVSSDQHVWAEYQSFVFSKSSVEGGRVVATYKPFVAVDKNALRGGEQEISNDCTIPSTHASWSNRILSWIGRADVEIASGDRTLNIGEKFNYIDGTITRAREGNVQDGGYCIVGNNEAKVYALESITTGSGSYNVVNVDKVIKSVQCCNGQNRPDQTCEDGRWISTAQAECSVFNSCSGVEWNRDYSTNNQIIRYQCVSGQCIPQTEQVECSADKDCSTNERCSRNTWTCEQAGIGGVGEERIPVDQQECTEKGWNWVPEKKVERTFIIETEEVIPAHCEKPTSIFRIVITFLIVVAVAFTLYYLWPYILNLLGGLRGVIGR